MTPRLFQSAVFTVFALGCHATQSTTDAGRPVVVEGACVVDAGDGGVDFLRSIGCSADFAALASEPIGSTLPGARSTKVVLDTAQDNVARTSTSVFPTAPQNPGAPHLE